MARITKVGLLSSLVCSIFVCGFEHGKESEAQAEAMAVSMMSGLDADKDGKMSVDELTHTLALAKHHAGDDPETTREWHAWLKGFNEADANKDLHLNIEELAYLLKHVSKHEGEKLFDDSLDSVMSGFDSNKDGKVDLKEILKHSEIKEYSELVDEIAKAFLTADKDKDRLLDREEMGQLLKHITKDEAEAIFNPLEPIMAKFDTDKDGKMSVDELTTMLALAKEKTGHDAETDREWKHWLDGFAESDRNKDLHLDLQELAHLLKHGSKFQRAEL